MNIVMMTNTYLPHVGGVARSVAAFMEEYRAHGHRVLVIAPEFDGRDDVEEGVVRVRALQKFNGSDFSVMLPVSGALDEEIEAFGPDIIHSHHPFLLGASAQRIAATHGIPLVFTHHTMYEEYTHYTPADSKLLKRFVAALSTDYANLAEHVFAPSESIAQLLKHRGVNRPLTVVPTGVAAKFFNLGSRPGLRAALGIPAKAFVIGYAGRLALEKNLGFLTTAVVRFLTTDPHGYFLVVGGGPCAREIRQHAQRAGVAPRVILTGTLDNALLTSAYRAMDVFAFASHSETQGMVLTEAMAARTPVVALDAPGVRDVVKDGYNGRLLMNEDAEVFSEALAGMARCPRAELRALRKQALHTAKNYSLETCAAKAVRCYEQVCNGFRRSVPVKRDSWEDTLNRISAEWAVIKGLAEAAGKALTASDYDTVMSKP